MKNIVCVGLSFPSDDYKYVEFDSQSSLSDYDLAIFYPSFYNTGYEIDYSQPTYVGKTLYNKDSSAQMSENMVHWRDEIKSLLDNGKNVYIILCEKKDCYIHTGSKSYSGTGRNQRVTEHVAPFDNYKFLPPYLGEIHNSTGQLIVPTHPAVKQLYEFFKGYMNYESYIKPLDETSDVLFTTKNKDKVLGLINKKDKGSIVLMPHIDFDKKEFRDEDDEGNDIWTTEALKLGKIFQDHILKIDKSISGELSKTPEPDWVSHKNYELKESELTKTKIKEKEQKIVEIQKEIEGFNATLEEQENLKGVVI